MADISAQPMFDLGALGTSYPRNEANIANTQSETAYRNGPLTELTGAQAGQAGAQTNLFAMQAQRASLEIQMIRDAMQSAKNLHMDGGREENKSGVEDPTETGVASSLNKKFYVDPAGNPKLLQLSMAYNAAGLPNVASQYEKLNDIMVKSQVAKNANEANDIFQTSSSLQDSDYPLQAILGLRPGNYLNNVGRAIMADPSMSPEEKNDAARTAIKAAAKFSHQYTNRELDKAGDQFVDKATGFPVHAPPIGQSPGEQLEATKFEHTPQTVTAGNRETTTFPDLNNPPQANIPAASGASPGSGLPGQEQGGPTIPGLDQKQSDFVRNRPPGFPQVPSSSRLTQDDVKQRDLYREQAKKLADATNIESSRAQDSITQIKRINALLNTPNLTLGPGSHEYSQFRTVLENWTGTPSGQAAAYQVLSKILNASEMNELLQQFHSEGAQVRLGAYESRLIMEKLAANPNLTKTAIKQMLMWQASDNQYMLDKTKVAGTLIQTGKDVANFDKEYGDAFPKKDIVDSTLKIIDPNAKRDFSKVSGKTYTRQEVSQAAAKLGIPLNMFQHQLEQNGATIK